MSDASVWLDDGPAKSAPPPLPSTCPVVKTVVPTGELIQFESEEERAATVFPKPAEPEKATDMTTMLRNWLKEEQNATGPDYMRKFYQIRVEQERIRSEPGFKMDCAHSPNHFARNRYRDILPYDHNRVEIERDEENPDGYMNASLITLPDSKMHFIAAQAPLPTTLDEWWKMIDEHKVCLIVMLCKLVEMNKIKCERYWPEAIGESELFGDYEITLEEEKTFDDDEYLLRVLKMENQTSGESRTIHQLHYREWPDHGCPSGEKQLLNMIEVMEKLHDEFAAGVPVLVHCSAGVGRTGTIIAINHVREHIKKGILTQVKIFELVLALRRQRASMVQTQDQFQFVHRCLATFTRRFLGIPEPTQDEVTTPHLPVNNDSSGSVRLIAPPTPTVSDPNGMMETNCDDDDSDATSVPDFPDEPPAPMGPEDPGNSAAF